MTSANVWGLLWGVLAGALAGTAAVFSKKATGWRIENIWLIYSCWSLGFFPGLIAWATIPHWGSAIRATPLLVLVAVFLFGCGWGFSNIGFAIGLQRLGLALTSVLIIGLGNAIGAMVPLLWSHGEVWGGPVGLAISAGVFITLVGIILCSIATWEKKGTDVDRSLRDGGRVARGIAICVASGILSSLFNLALMVGEPLERQAVRLGALPRDAANATWGLALFGGLFVTAGYCILQFRRNHSWRMYRSPGTGANWGYTFLMGLFWFGGVVLYGMSVRSLGEFGPSIGWPIFQSLQIAMANGWGIITGEWRNLSRGALWTRGAGLAVLFLGIAVIGWASTL
ncbi:L-rhamnose-proton symport protein RhaT [Hydrogenispora ethanolica]|uniref:L-rhamnose-proton symport protein RhaT n=1 Tax=Hydrogenispora ethanolica TaxID=1082276 RepID=A0A4R1RQ57_HYDET|nr:L-rhamnose/proton symporter RhaT [Hydrogenispora ethanolica]TCL68515.1 L-rhamnose-proton symport protein RhaT [Hydrogenispora ethanolica]